MIAIAEKEKAGVERGGRKWEIKWKGQTLYLHFHCSLL